MSIVRLLPLGVGEAFTARHYTTCMALGVDDDWLLIECPHPIRKMLREASTAAGLPFDLDRVVAVAISHLHADHCSGLERVNGFGRFTGQYIEDASFVKLRELSLSWQLPDNVRARMPWRVDNARITLSGRNLVTWTNYSGLDPEVSNFGNQQIARSVDVAPYPPSRTFWLTINLGL